MQPNAIVLTPFFKEETEKALQLFEKQEHPIIIFNNQIETNTIQCFVGQDLFKAGNRLLN